MAPLLYRQREAASRLSNGLPTMEVTSSMQATQNSTLQIISELEDFTPKAVIKRQGPGIFPSYFEHGPQLLSNENRRKIEPKEIPSCSIPSLLVVFTLATRNLTDNSIHLKMA